MSAEGVRARGSEAPQSTRIAYNRAVVPLARRHRQGSAATGKRAVVRSDSMKQFVDAIAAFAETIGGPGLFLDRLPRLVVPVVPAGQRPARHLDGAEEPGAGCRTTRRMATLGSVAGLPRAPRAWPAAGAKRSSRSACGQTGVDRGTDARPAVRRAGGARAVVAAAAGAVQALRAAGRRRRRAAGEVRARRRDRPRVSATSARASWRSGTATRRSTFLKTNGREVSLGLVARRRSSAVGGVRVCGAACVRAPAVA